MKRIAFILPFVATGCSSAVAVPETGTDAGTDTEVTSEDESGSGTSGTTSTAESSTSATSPSTTVTGDPPDPATAADVLFVVDNSGSMGFAQRKIALGAPSLIDGLESAGLSVRMAITTTDTGNFWCQGQGVSNPESGQFVASSCRSRLDDFYFSGNDTDASFACTDVCDADSVGGGMAWFENPTADDVACALPQGINGCGFETPLESMRLALERSADPASAEFGFVRPDAHLVVVVVSDEVDCSDNPAFELDIFSEEGSRVFWSLPDEQQSPTSALCWNAGVECVGDPSGYDDCSPQDFGIDGTPTAVGTDAVLYPVSRYTEELSQLRAEKAAAGADVFVFGVLGVPLDYSGPGSIPYAAGPNAQDQDSFQARFGIAPGCTSTDDPPLEAVPPVRMREFITSPALAAQNQLYSVCADDYGPAFSAMADAVGAFGG